MKKSIKVQRTAHYYLKPSAEAQVLLYVIHGYGQLAEDFLSDFDDLKDEKASILAPEALSKYYNKKGEAVASWMTSHEREDEMNDYINYLEAVHESVDEKYSKVYLLGYSQGVSTALRWLAHSKQKFDKVYLCSGSIPPELTAQQMKNQSQAEFHYFYGDQDPLLNESKALEHLKNLIQIHGKVSHHAFHGGHKISDQCIEQIINDIHAV